MIGSLVDSSLIVHTRHEPNHVGTMTRPSYSPGLERPASPVLLELDRLHDLDQQPP